MDLEMQMFISLVTIIKTSDFNFFLIQTFTKVFYVYIDNIQIHMPGHVYVRM